MKKSIKIVTVVILAALLSVTTLSVAACDNTKTNSHTHVWGSWQRDKTEHWRYCMVEDCVAEERAEHSDGTCSACGYGFKALAFGFVDGIDIDTAHSDFAIEANVWFPERGAELGFTYDYVGDDYSYLNDETLSRYDLVIFLNNRPWGYNEQAAFERYMKNGGAWMGFHSAAFSMREGYWDWYQSEFLGCGDYAKNTWNPTSEPLTVETRDHYATANIVDDVFVSAPSEWYGWEFDLFANEDITVLLTLNPTVDNPAGDQPDKSKQHEIWYDGCYPIAWANNNYNMVYMNWGHNLQSYNSGAEGKVSSTFASETQNQFMLDAMFGLVQNSLSNK